MIAQPKESTPSISWLREDSRRVRYTCRFQPGHPLVSSSDITEPSKAYLVVNHLVFGVTFAQSAEEIDDT